MGLLPMALLLQVGVYPPRHHLGGTVTLNQNIFNVSLMYLWLSLL